MKSRRTMLDDGKQESDLFIFNSALRSHVVAAVRSYTSGIKSQRRALRMLFNKEIK